MSTGLHKDLDFSEIHTVAAWVYADEAARLAATGFVAADLYKVAWQTSSQSLFVLAAYSPITWVELASGGGTLLNKVEFAVRNETGGTLNKGSCVYVSGWNSGLSKHLVDLADKADPDKRPAVGVLSADLANNANGYTLVSGSLVNIDTSSWDISDQLVLGSNGAFSRPPPDTDPFTGEVQNIGVVTRVDASGGHVRINTEGLNPVTATQIFALAGTSGTPSKTNKFVTNADSRNSDARTPTGSAGGDLTGSTYPNPTVANSAITNAKLANMAQSTIKGRAAAAGTGAPVDLTSAQATAIFDAFTAALKGLVPASGGGTVNFLRADGTFAVPPGAGGSFGSNVQQSSSDSESSTTSGTFQQKLRMTTASLPSGTYRIGWYYEWQKSGVTDFVSRVQINDSVDCMAGFEEAVDPGSDQWFPRGGFYYYTGSGVLNIDLDYHGDGSGTAYIRRARLEIWRVS